MGKALVLYAIGFAAIAAVGNAMFAFGQKKYIPAQNPFIFLIFTLAICLILFCITSLFFPATNPFTFFKQNYLWCGISGVGFFLTFVGFYFLYTRYGASYYIVYAVLSILTTAIIVGVVIFKEHFNMYHALATVSALVTVVFFSLGNGLGK